MLAIQNADIQARIARDNPWWATGSGSSSLATEIAAPKRIYFSSFKAIALDFSISRASVLLGPRRVGKTFMLKQLIHEAMESGIAGSNILYVSLDTPVYSGIALEKFLSFMPGHNPQSRSLVVLDEVQYLKNWEVHLKDLVDHYPRIKFIASGSAAAALRLKSQESGAGRFSDFMLPPLTFYEFLAFLHEETRYLQEDHGTLWGYTTHDIDGLNARFVDYLNYGGYPEVVLNEQIRKNREQFIRSDIVDKILLKDLPSLYGIADIQELNRLFAFLAYHSGNEISLENIAQNSGLTKPTIKRYIEYLESAFLIVTIPSADDSFRTMKRIRNFKAYLGNPSMYAALFKVLSPDDEALVGRLVETAIFSQWQHSASLRNLRYARWKNEGEVDMVYLTGLQKPLWMGEIKWSDRGADRFQEALRGMTNLLRRHRSIESAFLTTKSYDLGRAQSLEGRPLYILPSAVYCYLIGRNIAERLEKAPT